MRRRTIRKKDAPSQNLDSFLDILTNTVGVLMFIGLFISLLAVETGNIIRTPLKTDSKKIPQLFEIRNNQVFYLSDPNINRKIDQLLSNLPICSPPNIPENVDSYLYNYYLEKTAKYQKCMDVRYQKVQSFSYKTGYYLITFINGESIQYQPIANAKGENKQTLRLPESKFKGILKNLDPNNNYIAFLVRDDSFSTFRTAREQAWNQGFDVGWEPLLVNSTIIFGSGGRTIGVQ